MKITTSSSSSRKDIKTTVAEKTNKKAARTLTLIVLGAFILVIGGIVFTVGVILNMIFNPSIPGDSNHTTTTTAVPISSTPIPSTVVPTTK